MLLPNHAMAWNRLKPLKKRLESSEANRQHYVKFHEQGHRQRYAEKVPEHEVTTTDRKFILYIPHHSVYHRKEAEQNQWYSTAQSIIKENP